MNETVKARSHLGRKIMLGGLLVLVLGVIFSAMSKTPATVPVSGSTDTSFPAGIDTSVPIDTSVAAPVQPVGVVLFTAKGNGMKNLPPFTTSTPWNLIYRYDCSAYGGTGNFAVYDNDPNNLGVLANELSSGGSQTQYQTTVGSHQLQVNSECSWSLRAVTAN